MATLIGSGTTTLATYIPDLADAANIQTALKQLYYGTTAGTLSTTNGVYGALYTLYSGNPTLNGSVTVVGTVATPTVVLQGLTGIVNLTLASSPTGAQTLYIPLGGGTLLSTIGGTLTGRLSLLSPGSGSQGGLTIRAASSGTANAVLQFTNNAENTEWLNITATATSVNYNSLGTSHIFNGSVQVNSAKGLQVIASNGTAAPIKLAAGTNIGTPASGGIEYDGKVFYGTTDPGGAVSRNIISSTAVFVSSGYSRSNGSANTAYPIFGTNGYFSGAGTYEFEIVVGLGKTTSSHTISFSMVGNAGISSILYESEYINVASGGTPTSAFKVWSTSATATVISPTTSIGSGWFKIKGILTTTSIGTIVPSISLNSPWSNNPPLSVAGGSYWKMTPLGSSSFTSSGNFTA